MGRREAASRFFLSGMSASATKRTSTAADDPWALHLCQLWNAPTTVDFGNGLDLTIALSDASFSSVLAGILTQCAFSLIGTSITVSQTPASNLSLFATGLVRLLGW